MISGKQAQRRGPGCFGYGCLIAVVIFTVIIGGVWFLALRGIRGAVEQYTAASASELPPIVIDVNARSTGLEKLNELKTAVERGSSLTVELSDKEIQAIIDSTPWRDRLRISLNADQVALVFAFPLAELGDWYAASFLVGDIKQRFLVGRANARVAFNDNSWRLSFSELTLNDRELAELPRGHAGEWIVGAISNLIKDSDTSEPGVISLKQIRELAIRDERLMIRVAGK